MNTRKSRLVLAVAATFATAMAGNAQAAFFQLAENSASGLGNAFAGGAAIAEDASAVWYNPAGLTRLSGSQLVVAGHLIQPSTEFSPASATTVLGGPISGGNGGDAGEFAVVPNIYFSHQFSDRLTFGLGINAPFGLATDYNDGWVGRYHADRSEIMSININPALGFKLSEQFSIGVGVNYQKLEAELSQAIDFATICTTAAGGAFSGVCGNGAGFNPNTNPNDGFGKVTADDDAWGYNLGILWQVGNGTRLGLAYRSKMEYELSGNLDITVPGNVPAPLVAGGGFVDSGAKADVTLPATFSLSAYHQITPAWAIMGDITRTNWSDLPELRIVFDSAQPNSVTTLRLEDVYRYSIGGVYSASGGWTYRAGLALDQSPTPNARDRSVRLPDENRIWLAFGVGYKPSKTLNFDVGLAYIKLDDPVLAKTTADAENAARGNLSGTYESDVKILSGQVNWKF